MKPVLESGFFFHIGIKLFWGLEGSQEEYLEKIALGIFNPIST